MAKPMLHGGRWKALKTVGQGGQAQVFLVSDTTKEFEGEFALKRVKNLRRRDRFLNEIEAIKLLQHPNVVRLVDHSALDDGGEAFIVMPCAQGGDLSQRVGAFKGAIDATVAVALQLASALAAAHQHGIVHRDIKPANILFVDHGLDVWLADFGICLVRDKPRNTKDNEIVGPRGGFMAPECEDGGQLDVTPAADVYSLGKVMYFMFSGGRALPREKLSDEAFALEFSDGQRALLVKSLLKKMISPIEKRLSSMVEVTRELEKIRDWRAPTTAAVSERARSLLSKHQEKVSEVERITEENEIARRVEAEAEKSIATGFEAWIVNELEQIAATMQMGSANCTVVSHADARQRLSTNGSNKQYHSIGEWRLQYVPSDRDPRNYHILRIYLCEVRTVKVTVHVGPRPQEPQLLPPRDFTFAMVAGYAHAVHDNIYTDAQGFFSQAALIGTTRVRPPATTADRNRPQSMSIRRMMAELNDSYSQVSTFRGSDWPNAMQSLHEVLQAVTESFIEEISDPSSVAGY